VPVFVLVGVVGVVVDVVVDGFVVVVVAGFVDGVVVLLGCACAVTANINKTDPNTVFFMVSPVVVVMLIPKKSRRMPTFFGANSVKNY